MKHERAKPPTSSSSRGDEALNSNGWPCVPLREICERVDYGFTASADFSIEEPRFLRITDIQNGTVMWDNVPGCKISESEAAENRLEDGDIVFARTGATTGKSFLICNPPKAVFASYLIRLRLKSGVSPEFISLFLQSEDYWKQIRAGARGGIQPNFNATMLGALSVLLPPLAEQRRIVVRLRDQLAAVAQARAAVQAQTETLDTLIHAVLRESLSNRRTQPVRFADCLHEVTAGIGDDWRNYPVLGATREGLAPAKEPVGKNPGRYKPVRQGTIFYNPMRILLGSIAMLDEADETGITSPDYVVMTAIEGRLNARWFYHWFRSRYGAEFIKSMTRGAVRERLMFRRLAPARIVLPDLRRQEIAADQFAEIKRAKARLTEKLIALEHVPAALLREAFSGNF